MQEEQDKSVSTMGLSAEDLKEMGVQGLSEGDIAADADSKPSSASLKSTKHAGRVLNDKLMWGICFANILGSVLVRLLLSDTVVNFDVSIVGALFLRLVLLLSMQYALLFGVLQGVMLLFKKIAGTFLTTWTYITGLITLMLYVGLILELTGFYG